MVMNKKAIMAAVISAAMIVPVVSHAQSQDRGFYAGASIGQSDVQDGCDGLSGVAGISCDDSDSAWKIFGGYRLNPNLAVELGYTDLGEISASGFGVNVSAESSAWELVGVGSFPINNQFSIYGKLGMYRAETDGRSNVGVAADESNTGLTFGFGVAYNFTRAVAVRAEWQKYSDVGGGNVGESDVDVMSVGLVVNF